MAVKEKRDQVTKEENAIMDGYEITVGGECIVYSDAADRSKGKMTKPYEIKVRLKSLDSALSIIKNRVLEPVLRKKFPEYYKFRTHEILDVVPLGDTSERADQIDAMNRQQLLKFIKDEGLPVDPSLFKKIGKLREAITKAVTDPKGFPDWQEDQKRSKEEADDILARNPEFGDLDLE